MWMTTFGCKSFFLCFFLHSFLLHNSIYRETRRCGLLYTFLIRVYALEEEAYQALVSEIDIKQLHVDFRVSFEDSFFNFGVKYGETYNIHVFQHTHELRNVSFYSLFKVQYS